MYKVEILDEKEDLLLLKEFKYRVQLEKWLDGFKNSGESRKYIGLQLFAYFFVNDEKIIEIYNETIRDYVYEKFKNDKVKRRRGLLKR